MYLGTLDALLQINVLVYTPSIHAHAHNALAIKRQAIYLTMVSHNLCVWYVLYRALVWQKLPETITLIHYYSRDKDSELR